MVAHILVLCDHLVPVPFCVQVTLSEQLLYIQSHHLRTSVLGWRQTEDAVAQSEPDPPVGHVVLIER